MSSGEEDEILEFEEFLSPNDHSKNIPELISTVKMKNLLRSNSKVGKLSPIVPHLLVKATEKFLKEIYAGCEVALKCSEKRNLVHSIVKKSILDNTNFQMLHEMVSEIPDDDDDATPEESSIPGPTTQNNTLNDPPIGADKSKNPIKHSDNLTEITNIPEIYHDNNTDSNINCLDFPCVEINDEIADIKTTTMIDNIQLEDDEYD